MQAGGDLLIGTNDGIVPISAAISKDPAALSLSAVTRAIEPEWQTEAAIRTTLPWEIIKWPIKNMALVSLPATGGQQQACLVVNVETGAWAKYTGWDTRCFALHNENVYFGTSDGNIKLAENGGSDSGSPYTAVAVCSFDHLKRPGLLKVGSMAQAMFRSSRPFEYQISASTDYQVSLPAPPASVSDDTAYSAWDTGLWDVAIWDGAGSLSVSHEWRSIGVTGYTHALQIQVTCGVTPTPDAELLSIDYLYSTGGTAV